MIKNTKKYKYKKKKKKKNIYIPYIIFLTVIVLIYLVKNIYVNYKCKELYNAIEYIFTTNACEDSSLIRVKNMALEYSDDEKAIIKVSGLNKNPPHELTTIKGELKKNPFNSWELVKYEEINENN